MFAAPPCFVLGVSQSFFDVLAVRSSYLVSLHRRFPALRIKRKRPRTMAAWAAAARQAAASARLPSLKPSAPRSTPGAATLVHRRGLAGGGEHHGPPKVNFWEDPLSPSKWKEEHFVIVSLTGWGLLFYGGYKYFTRGKNDKKEEKAKESSH
ncbi:hypothetical protein ACJRO7_023119 [Eucalyptus globulus]|uniref:Uncharacterized protein n=1 Tax=Eucalyptus globulus TaxID=34317 RepID=A0ABD3K0Q2_EUCGL